MTDYNVINDWVEETARRIPDKRELEFFVCRLAMKVGMCAIPGDDWEDAEIEDIGEEALDQGRYVFVYDYKKMGLMEEEE